MSSFVLADLSFRLKGISNNILSIFLCKQNAMNYKMFIFESILTVSILLDSPTVPILFNVLGIFKVFIVGLFPIIETLKSVIPSGIENVVIESKYCKDTKYILLLSFSINIPTTF